MYEEYIVFDGKHICFKHGTQTIYIFPNNYGASVVTGEGSYGGLELAVIWYPTKDNKSYIIDSTTDVTSDVLGWLETDNNVYKHLQSIEGLPKKTLKQRRTIKKKDRKGWRGRI